MVAAINGLIGSALTFWVAIRILGLSPGVALWACASSQIAAAIALLSTLKMERMPTVKRLLIPNGASTWTVFAGLYFGIVVALVPELRDKHRLLWLAAPLVWSTGLFIVVFGPIQDWIVTQLQREAARKLAQSKDLS